MLRRIYLNRIVGDELEEIVASGDYPTEPIDNSIIKEAKEKVKKLLRDQNTVKRD